MFTLIYRSLSMTVILALFLCGAYPLMVTFIGKVFFPEKSAGGIITLSNGKAVGSRLIGQSFTRPEYFHGRPSVAGASAGSVNGYDAVNSAGSNLGSTHPKWVDSVRSNVEKILKENPNVKRGEIPVDLVTYSGSGLDPHISPASALIQVERVAKARGASGDQRDKIEALVWKQIENPAFGILGEPVIHVLELNLALDRDFPFSIATVGRLSSLHDQERGDETRIQ